MQINRLTDHAIRILVILVQRDETILAPSLAKELHISPRYLMKVGSTLREAGYVSVEIGPRGGYSLNANPYDIGIREIIELMEGPLRISKCSYADPCKPNGPCSLQKMYSDLQQLLIDYMQNITIEN